MRPTTDPGPTCDDGVDHIWIDATEALQRQFREPVAKSCSRCGRAVGPKDIGRIQAALQERNNRNGRLADFFESIGDDLVAAATATSDGNRVLAARHLDTAGQKLKQGASILRG